MNECREVKAKFGLHVPCCDDCHPHPHRMRTVAIPNYTVTIGMVVPTEDLVAEVCCIVEDALEEAGIT